MSNKKDTIVVGNKVKVKVMGYILQGVVESITDNLAKIIISTYYGNRKEVITVFDNLDNLVLDEFKKD